jgi:hypothetical protein
MPVNVALVILVLLYAEASIRMIIRAGWGDPMLYIAGLPTLAIIWFILINLYTGAWWARVAFLALTICGVILDICQMAFRDAGGLPHVNGYQLGGILCRLFALILLFTARSNEWFNQMRTVRRS